MSKGRRTFNLQDKEQMEEFNRLFRRDYGRKDKRVGKDEEHISSDGNMRDASGAI